MPRPAKCGHEARDTNWRGFRRVNGAHAHCDAAIPEEAKPGRGPSGACAEVVSAAAMARGLLGRRGRHATGSGGSSHSIGSGRRARAWAITSSTSATGNQLQVLLHVVRDFRQVLLILLRDEHGRDPGPQRRQQLLLQAADRQHAAAQRDLAGHRHVAADRDAGQHRDDRGRHRHAGRRTVLRRRAFRHVDMDVALVEQRRLDAEADRRGSAHSTAPRDTLSCITSPSLPVCLTLPLPGSITDSMVRISPPTSVQARPVTTPTMSSASVSPKRNFRTPANFSRFFRRDRRPSWSCLVTISFTALRARLAISRSRLRTPASRV